MENIKDYIKIEDLKVSKAYEVDARNFDTAIWTGKSFAGVRYKFTDIFIDHEYHYDDGDGTTGTVKPIRELK